jgi:glycosyltransferase involved in cell wall biosynthesis
MRDDVYARTRVLLMPSERETWGRVGVEAMCSGIPVIAHPTEGLRESLGVAGMFVDRDDVAGWVRTVHKLMTRANSWRYASRLALKRSAELNPAKSIEQFAERVEALQRDRSVPA